MTIATETAHLTDFMCVCSEESKAEAEACFERVCAELDATAETLLTRVVYALHWGLYEDGSIGAWEGTYSAAINGIDCDQWCAVSAEVRRYDTDAKKYVDHARIWVQCDRVEHGIARVWELAKEAAA